MRLGLGRVSLHAIQVPVHERWPELRFGWHYSVWNENPGWHRFYALRLELGWFALGVVYQCDS